MSTPRGDVCAPTFPIAARCVPFCCRSPRNCRRAARFPATKSRGAAVSLNFGVKQIFFLQFLRLFTFDSPFISNWKSSSTHRSCFNKSIFNRHISQWYFIIFSFTRNTLKQAFAFFSDMILKTRNKLPCVRIRANTPNLKHRTKSEETLYSEKGEKCKTSLNHAALTTNRKIYDTLVFKWIWIYIKSVATQEISCLWSIKKL